MTTSDPLRLDARDYEPVYISNANEDEDEEIEELVFASFRSIRNRTLETLYNYDSSKSVNNDSNNDNNHSMEHNTFDKSVKGSVDSQIQHLVDLINRHPCYATLSSCAGRIALFDPGLHAVLLNNDDDDDDDNSDEREKRVHYFVQGKGNRGGGWLLVAHDCIQAQQLIDVLSKDPQKEHTREEEEKDRRDHSVKLQFKLEPMLLHVAAASLARGQQLLQIALAQGFRESGLIITKTRVTVAIRSHRLSLNIPFAREGVLRPPNAYLTALVHDANQRLKMNWTRIDALYNAILQSSLFRLLVQRTPSLSTSSSQSLQSMSAMTSDYYAMHATPLPNLYLSGHATVAVNDYDSNSSVSILSFGGYGVGPTTTILNKNTNTSCERRVEGSIYRLRKTATHSSDWRFSSSWERLHVQVNPSWNGFHAAFGDQVQIDSLEKSSFFPACEGLAACCIPIPTNAPSCGTMIAIFGGRTSPQHPLNHLFVCEYDPTPANAAASSNSISMGTIRDIRGVAPLPRYGHSFSAITSSTSSSSSSFASIYDDGASVFYRRTLAVVFGGHDEHGPLNSLHTLSHVAYDHRSSISSSSSCSRTITPHEPQPHFLWETVLQGHDDCNPLSLSLPCRFHHDVVAFQNHLFVFGGLESDNLLEPFSPSPPHSSFVNFDGSWDHHHHRSLHNVLVLSIDYHYHHRHSEQGPTLQSIRHVSTLSNHPNTLHYTPKFGHCASLLASSANTLIVALSGGVPITNIQEEEEMPPQLELVQLSTCTGSSSGDTKVTMRMLNLKISLREFAEYQNEGEEEQQVATFGTLVHHSACVVPHHHPYDDNEKNGSADHHDEIVELVITGGGVPGFGFQRCNGHSFALRLQRVNDENNHKNVLTEEWSAQQHARKVKLRRPVGQKSHTPRVTRISHSASSTTIPVVSDWHAPVAVVYVHKSNAKALKTYLEKRNWLNSLHRMAPAAASAAGDASSKVNEASDISDGCGSGLDDCIAVPVTAIFLQWLEDNSRDRTATDLTALIDEHEHQKVMSWIVGRGIQPLPRSTATYARQQRVKPNRSGTHYVEGSD